jgi:serine/threonine protein kinase/TolA-binding protein
VDLLNKYEIISELGRGAMGAVYKARDPLINRLVALKTITPGPGTQANLVERFYQEARSAGALQHPNIVTIYELGNEKNTAFISMEYLEGESLDRLIEQHPALPLSVKLGYIVKVCDALDYAHQHNVVHRDIKPGNIMVTKDGVVKVVDFGIARLADMTMTQPNMMLGSRAYMSPQLYKGERADARSDIWAVGVTLYELLSYRRPFTADNEAELMFHILNDPPPELQSLSPECTEDLLPIVAKMLEKNITDRYQSMQEVLHHLEPIWRSAQQSTVSGLLSDCRDLVGAGDLQRAQALLRKALEIDVGNTQAKNMLEKVTSELRRTQILPRLQEHLNRGEAFLKSGHFREARGEAQAALGLDSRHEPAQKLVAEAEAAVAKAQQVEQKLRLTKQRLAEGALTDAAFALQQAIAIDDANPQAQELKKQIADENARREKRKKVSEILHRARSLWTALNYAECLTFLDAALQEFPNEPELLKLRETAKSDQLEQLKQQHIGEVRKLLARQDFAEARTVLDGLLHDHPQDTAVIYLQELALQQEQDQKRQKRLLVELTSLRGLLAREKFKQVVTRGESLLQEYPQEFELTEMVDYARGEAALQAQKRQQEELEKRVHGFMNCERYGEALEAAREGIKEFPNQDSFRKLAADAEAVKQEQDAREHARLETQRRLHEMNSMLKQDKITDAIDLGQQTLETLGPDPNVTQLLLGAEQRRTQKDKAAQERQVELRTSSSSFVKEPQPAKAHTPPALDKLAQPEPEVSAADSRQKDLAPAFSAQRVPATSTVSQDPPAVLPPDTSVRAAARNIPDGAVVAASVHTPAFPPPPGSAAVHPVAGSPTTPIFRRTPVLTAIGIVLATIIIWAAWSRTSRHRSDSQHELAQQALQLWQDRKFDQSERTWRQVSQTKGPMQHQANQQINDIEQKRTDEQRQFDQAETLLRDQKDFVHAAQEFQDVIDLNLWHVDEATRELAVAKADLTETDIHKEEQNLFDNAIQLFQNNDYNKASKEFRAMLSLNVPASTLASQAETYLSKIRTLSDEQKLYDAALDDVKNENWILARDQFQTVITRKGPQTAEAKKHLAEVQKALQVQTAIETSIHDGAFRAAKGQLDSVQQWTRTQDKLTREMRAAEQQQFDDIRNNAQLAENESDASAVQRVQDDLHKFEVRAEDASLLVQSKELERRLEVAYSRAVEKAGDKSVFDAAVAHFEQAKQKKDLDRLTHAVNQEFQKIANGSGIYHEQAASYLKFTIPNAVQAIYQSSGKVALPPIACGPGSPSAPASSVSKAVSCAQLDASPLLQWAGVPTVDFPDIASQPGKLPYVLNIIVTADENGNVKIDKQGNVDKDFFKKAKDASKHWKTTPPVSQGKPVTIRFPLTITFQH